MDKAIEKSILKQNAILQRGNLYLAIIESQDTDCNYSFEYNSSAC